MLTFLGRKLHGGFAGEIMGDWKRRWPGARVKHWMKRNWIKMKRNWIKMYDKHGCIPRIETVINDPYEFKVRRRSGRRGGRTLMWHPLPKGVAFLPRYATVSAAANNRYLESGPRSGRVFVVSGQDVDHRQWRGRRYAHATDHADA